MPERVRFYFDPICPWCYQTSRWIRRLAQLGEAEVDWGLFSLEVQNAGHESEDMARSHSRSGLALRTSVLVRVRAGGSGVGELYRALGERYFRRGEPLEELATVEAALADAGLDPLLASHAADDHSLWEQVMADHRELVERTQSFGVPTIVLDGDDGPAMFGPVISRVPASDEEAAELFHHVAWLVRYENFSELKRERSQPPDVRQVRQAGPCDPGSSPSAPGRSGQGAC